MDYTIANISPIVLLPFFAFVINIFIVRIKPSIAAWVSCLSIFGSFLYSFRIFKQIIFTQHSADFYIHKVFNWIDLYTFQINMGIYIDNMTAIMLVMVSGIAFLVHIFSTYYMKDDPHFGRFFVYISLFTSAMLALVLSDNLLSFFIFWELMGFCSYSLIGFYYEKEDAGNASLKAFMTTRVGDVFFLLGILAIWSIVGNVTFVDIYVYLARGSFANAFVMGMPLITFAAGAIFMGTVGKSAQFPLQIWLPDAMVGPTPCSALIHAATMVAAGVYLSLRIFPLLEMAEILPLVAYIGGVTAFGAATMAVIQTDIKSVLAYSTISQLGYMILGIGSASYNAAFMHLITHAIFKACLFLSAGSIIHSLHVQEMARMGGLRRKLPYTFLAMLLCTFAIAGLPLFSGFVSKDRILGDAFLMAMEQKIYIIPTVLGFLGALLTSFYMFRMMFLTFFGKPRDRELYDHIELEHLSWNRNIPLLILTIFTLGFWYSGSLTGQGFVKVLEIKNYEWFQTLVVKPSVEKFQTYQFQKFSSRDERPYLNLEKSQYDAVHKLSEKDAAIVHSAHSKAAILSIIVFFTGLFFASMMYLIRVWSPHRWMQILRFWYIALKNKYYMDDLYIKIFIGRQLLPFNEKIAKFDRYFLDHYIVDGWQSIVGIFFKISSWFDDVVIDKMAVGGVSTTVSFFNIILRNLQRGKVQFYFIVIIFVLAGYIWIL